MNPRTDPKVWAACSKEILKLATPKLAALGFKRTKPTLFTRQREHWCEFIHVHKFTGNPRYRLHAGIRILNSSFPACALNGPCTLAGDRRFPLSFINSPDSWERCSDEFPKFASLVAEPWFDMLSTSDAILASSSPLRADDQAALRDALAGKVSPENIALSKKELGIK